MDKEYSIIKQQISDEITLDQLEPLKILSLAPKGIADKWKEGIDYLNYLETQGKLSATNFDILIKHLKNNVVVGDYIVIKYIEPFQQKLNY